ncbi:hypothetical protein GCM10027589_36220 [Actinocorallia lasiicapitis]
MEQNLVVAAHAQLDLARTAPQGHSAEVVLRSGPLTQTVIGLVAGAKFDEDEVPAAASLQVLAGTVMVGDDEFGVGDLTAIPAERRTLTAIDAAVVLLTAVTGS